MIRSGWVMIVALTLFMGATRLGEATEQIRQSWLVIPVDQRARFVTAGSALQVDAPSSYFALGDRLDLFNNSDPFQRPVGQIRVDAINEGQVTATIVAARRELDSGVVARFPSGLYPAHDPFHAFAKTLSHDLLAKAPGKTIGLAVIDVVTPTGDRTAGGDAITALMVEKLCRRPQFHCVDRAKLAHRLHKKNVVTSLSIIRESEPELLGPLGVDVIVTGHLIATKGVEELAIRARKVGAPYEMWRLFRLDHPLFALPLRMAKKVTYKAALLRPGRLIIKLAPPGSIVGKKVEWVTYTPLDGSDPFAAYQPGPFFVRVDGEEASMEVGGRFFDRRLLPGRRTIVTGYTLVPERENRAASFSDKAQKKVELQFEVEIEPGVETKIVVMGEVRRIDRSEKIRGEVASGAWQENSPKEKWSPNEAGAMAVVAADAQWKRMAREN